MPWGDMVSIHTPNEGSDVTAARTAGSTVGFNPHSQ